VTAAGAALEAQLWGKARQHLDDAEACLGTDEAPGSLAPARYFRLRARIEEAESGDARTAGQWLLRASNAPADPRWVCRACGEVSAEWHGVCGRCGGFDTMDWRSPAPVGVIGAERPPELGLKRSPGRRHMGFRRRRRAFQQAGRQTQAILHQRRSHHIGPP
jgi:uncharacterized membrane-anchored protein